MVLFSQGWVPLRAWRWALRVPIYISQSCTYENTLSLLGPQLAYQYNGSPVPESGVFPEEAF